jgi:ribosome hibernation promoting factor
MRLDISGRHLAVTAATRKFAEQRLAHTLKLLNNSAVSAHVGLMKERGRIRAEISLHVKYEHFLHGAGTGPDPESAIGAAADRVERQADKLKGKWNGRRRRLPAVRPAPAVSVRDDAAPVQRRVAARPPSPNGSRRIIRARRYAVKPMSIEDAAAEIGDGSDEVIVFRNSASDAVMVLYRRRDGHLGLIEPEP